MQQIIAVVLLVTAFSAAADGEPIPEVKSHAACGSGSQWFQHDNRCYYWSNQKKENWFQAEFECRAMGGGLVTITNSKLNEVLRAMAQCKYNSWIGLVNTDTSLRGSIKGYSWWDNTPQNYTNFIGSSSEYYNCGMQQSSGKWRNYPCQSNLPYLCTTSPRSQQKSVAEDTKHHSCPSGWFRYKNNCYYSSEKPSNYFNAQMRCQALGATVVSILSQQEQVHLTIAMGCDTAFWIGLEKSRPCFNDPSKQYCWVWMDRSDVDYTTWYTSLPGSRREMECAYSIGDWKVANCYNEYRFVCKKPAAAAY